MLNWMNLYTIQALSTTPTRFVVRTLTLLLIAMSVVGLIYVFFLLDDWAFDGRRYTSGEAIIHLLMLSVLAMFYADYAGIRAGRHSMQEVLLKPETQNQLTAIHAQARLKVWRLTMIMVGWRLTVLLLIGLELREQLLPGTMLATMLASSPLSMFPILMTIMIVMTVLAAGIYLVEPIWRLRTTTAFGMWVALRNRDTEANAYWSRNFGWLLAYWLGLYSLLIVVTGFARQLDLPSSFISQGDVWGWAIIVGVIVMALVLYNERVTQRYLRQSQQLLTNPPQQRETLDQAHQDWLLQTTGWQGYSFWQRLFTWSGLIGLMHSDNPLFIMEARTLKHGGTTTGLQHWTRRILFRMVLVFLIMGGGLLIVVWNNHQQSLAYYPGMSANFIQDVVFTFLGISVLGLAGLSILANGLLDFSSIGASLNSINRDMAAGRWDLMRLTLLPEKQILVAKHRITQLRAWRIMIWIFGMRLLSVILTLLALLIVDPFSKTSIVEQMFREFARRPLVATTLAIILLIFVTVYLLEPFWRQQAMTAVGLAVSAGRNTINGLLTGLAAIIGIWISQGFIIYLLLVGMSAINSLVFAAFYGSYPNYISRTPEEYELLSAIQMGMLLTACFVTAVVIFFYYSLLQRLNLRVMQRRAFAE